MEVGAAFISPENGRRAMKPGAKLGNDATTERRRAWTMGSR